MNWLRHVIIDLVVTALVLAAVATNLAFLRGLVLGYVVLMLLLKGATAFGGGAVAGLRTKTPDVPVWFFHLMYAVNVGAGVAGAFLWTTPVWWWCIAGGWALIWGLSILSERQAQATRRAK
jgi:hypothetical protein